MRKSRRYLAEHDNDTESMCVCGHNADDHASHDHQMLRFQCRECPCLQFDRGKDVFEAANMERVS